MKRLLKVRSGMSLTMMIVLGFVAAVALIFVIGAVAYVLNS